MTEIEEVFIDLKMNYDRWCNFLNQPRLNFRITEEHKRLLAGVVEWQACEPLPEIGDLNLEVAIGTGKKVCPLCSDFRGVYLLAKGVDSHGDDTGKRLQYQFTCRCMFYKRLYPRLYNAKIVPEKYRTLDLYSLQPSGSASLPYDRQAAIIGEVKKKPTSNFLMCGPAGTGKTTLSTALYIYALRDWAWASFIHGHTTEAVWRISANDLLEEFRIHSFDNGQVPTVTQNKIIAARKAGFVPKLFLEELDKIGETRTQRNNLFKVCDWIYEQEGQLVATSNMNTQKLINLLGGVDGEYGEQIIRRFIEGGSVLEFFETPKSAVS